MTQVKKPNQKELKLKDTRVVSNKLKKSRKIFQREMQTNELALKMHKGSKGSKPLRTKESKMKL